MTSNSCCGKFKFFVAVGQNFSSRPSKFSVPRRLSLMSPVGSTPGWVPTPTARLRPARRPGVDDVEIDGSTRAEGEARAAPGQVFTAQVLPQRLVTRGNVGHLWAILAPYHVCRLQAGLRGGPRNAVGASGVWPSRSTHRRAALAHTQGLLSAADHWRSFPRRGVVIGTGVLSRG
jgi:hypothetical protein